MNGGPNLYQKSVALLFCVIVSAATFGFVSKARAEKISAQNLTAYQRFLFAQNSIAPTSLNPSRRQGKRTDGAIVIVNGRTVFEQYARGYNKDKKHIMWSTSKTVMALLYGVALKEHRVNLSDSICKYVTAIQPGQCGITVGDLLQWSSGLKWNEIYEKGNILASSVIAMLYGVGHRDMAAYVLSHPLEPGIKPGTSWRYSSGDSLLAANILQKVYAGQNIRSVFRQKLFAPLGMKHWIWESDLSGTIGGAFYFYSSARDLARLGQIFLDHGKINGKRLVDPHFIDFMETIPPAFTMRRPADPHIHDVSGATLWINKPAIGKESSALNVPAPWPFAPPDTVATIGHWGQYLVVIPSLHLIAVRIGDTRDDSFPIGNYIKQTVRLVRGEPVIVKKYVPRVAKPSKLQPSSLLWRLRAAPLALGYMSKMACSCLFVSKSSAARCRNFSYVPQVPMAKLEIDWAQKRTRAVIPWLSLFLHADAKYVSSEKGCVLE